jgi:hypothetical protein
VGWSFCTDSENVVGGQNERQHSLVFRNTGHRIHTEYFFLLLLFLFFFLFLLFFFFLLLISLSKRSNLGEAGRIS